MHRYLTLLLFIGLAWGQTTIAVFDLENNGLKDSEVKILTDRLQSELVKVGGYTVVERKKIEKVFEEQKFQMSGCVEECLIEVGVLLGAKEIVIGSVGRFGSIYTVSARLVNATTGEMIQSSDFDSDEGIGILLTLGMEEIALELADKRNLVVKPKVNNKTKKNNYPKSAIEKARQAKEAADKAASAAAAATTAAIEAAASRAAKEASANFKRKKEEEEARKLAETQAAEEAELDAAASAAAEEAKRRMRIELGLELDEEEPVQSYFQFEVVYLYVHEKDFSRSGFGNPLNISIILSQDGKIMQQIFVGKKRGNLRINKKLSIPLKLNSVYKLFVGETNGFLTINKEYEWQRTWRGLDDKLYLNQSLLIGEKSFITINQSPVIFSNVKSQMDYIKK